LTDCSFDAVELLTMTCISMCTSRLHWTQLCLAAKESSV